MSRKLWLALVLALGACDEPRSDAHTADRETNYKPVATVLKPADIAQKVDGIATLVNPDQLAQINADLKAAEITSKFSKRAFKRYQTTKSLPEHFVDTAERQSATDATQLALLELKLRNAWGDTAPFLDAEKRQQLVDELSSGKTTLVRIDFPTSVEREPKNVRVKPLGGGEESSVGTVWAAPSGSLAMPGTSFFGLMSTGPGLRPGDRAKVTAEASAPLSGVVVPASAVVVYQGASWCYVEDDPGEFERKAISLAHPVETGYLVDDFTAGTKVVTRGASVLLSREAEPAIGADDDDGGDADAPPKPVSLQTGHKPPAPIASSDPD